MIKDLYPRYIKKTSYNSIKKTDTQYGQRAWKALHTQGYANANKNMKMCSISLFIRKIKLNPSEIPLSTQQNGFRKQAIANISETVRKTELTYIADEQKCVPKIWKLAISAKVKHVHTLRLNASTPWQAHNKDFYICLRKT